MRFGLRGTLFALAVLLTVATGITASVLLERQLRRNLEQRIEDEMLRHAHAAAVLVEIAPVVATVTSTDPLADALGEAMGVRVTIIAADGTVLGDSELPARDVRQMENHGRRPEVIAARAHGDGISRRFSTTLRSELLYVAVPYQRSESAGVARVATPLEEVASAVQRLRTVIVTSGLVNLALALLIVLLGFQYLARTVRILSRNAREMAAGRTAKLASGTGDDDLGWLAQSLNQMGRDLDHTVSELARERDRLEAVLEGMEAAVVALDDQQRVTLVNSSARSLLELADSPVGSSLLEIVRVPALHELVHKIKAGELAAGEFDLPGAQRRRVLARGTPQRATGGAVLVMHDVTHLRRLETVRRDFVANVSHELRTPVSVIRANAETLLDGALEDPAVGKGFVEAVLRNSERLSRIIADLMDLARIESGKYEVERRSLSLQQAVTRAVEAVEHNAEQRDIDLRIDVDPAATAVADAKALDQVLLNLLDNAVKYTPQGGTVAVRTRRLPDLVRVEVEDTGLGIEPQHRARIFERFYRVDTGRSREMGGTGLGLAIVKHLVDQMGGDVGVAPAAPRGSVFWFVLPLEDRGVERQPAAPPGEPRAGAEAIEPTPIPARGDAAPGAGRPRSAGASFLDHAREPAIPDSLDDELPGEASEAFQGALQQLRDRLLLMAGRVEEMISDSTHSLINRDAELAQRTIERDARVNLDEIEIDELCLKILAQHSPGATDLRFISLSMKMVTDLERIGDLAVNICERSMEIAEESRFRHYEDIHRLGDLVESMVRDAIDAFVARNADEAWEVITRDDLADDLYHRVFREIHAEMQEGDCPFEIGIHLQSAAKFLERMADHSTNVAEQVIFMIKGRDIRHIGKLDPR